MGGVAGPCSVLTQGVSCHFRYEFPTQLSEQSSSLGTWNSNRKKIWKLKNQPNQWGLPCPWLVSMFIFPTYSKPPNPPGVSCFCPQALLQNALLGPGSEGASRTVHHLWSTVSKEGRWELPADSCWWRDQKCGVVKTGLQITGRSEPVPFWGEVSRPLTKTTSENRKDTWCWRRLQQELALT